MKFLLALLLLGFFAISPIISIAQRGKDLSYTVTTTNDVVNTYTTLTANAAVNATSITVASNTMAGAHFSGNLAAGDLILIMQMQGAGLDISTINTTFTSPIEYQWDPTWSSDPLRIPYWGKVLDNGYGSCGLFEQVEVLSVSGSNTINLNCPLTNAYTVSGHVQIVRVPRFENLTLNTNTSIVPVAWGASNTGGILAIEVNGNLVINANAKLTASGKGFRGAVADNVGLAPGSGTHSNGAGNGGTQLGASIQSEGARKGEGIGGYTTEYAALYSSYGRGAPANGGGGGGFQNSGGGGGSNVGTGTYTGKGIPSSSFSSLAWNLEVPGFATTSSPGGGRGGYSLATINLNATLVGPNNSSWGGQARQENGGFGGHSLIYDASRLFMGGGGGAGDQDGGQAGPGGAGGGIVFLTVYGNVSGTGSIEADGAVGSNSNPTGASPGIGQKKGNDGAGGAGGGGAIYIKNANALPSTLSLFARGGTGGNHALLLGTGASNEAGGPGGGGAGGSIAFTSGSPVQNVTGGAAGICTVNTGASIVSEFTVNGATNGGNGMSGLAAPIFTITANNQTICAGASVTLTASVTGTLPGTLTWYTQQFGGSSVGTGTTYTPSPAPTSTTTYYVGVCPGTFRIPVVVTVNPKPVINGTATLTNPTCTGAGSITGLTVSGGLPTYTYSWNGTTTVGPDYTNIGAGSYTLTVTDANGCTATSGPHVLVGTAGPIINAAAVAVVNENCNGTLGSISGITASGTGLSYAWSPSGGSAIDASNLAAGSYTLTVTDGNGCIASSGPFNVGFTAGPSVNTTAVAIQNTTCGNNNGAITGITASGTSLSFAWSNGGGSSLDASNLAVGSYSLTITDGNGCTTNAGPYAITALTPPSISTIGAIITPENCNLGNGAISGVVINGGVASFTYSWTNTAQTSLNLSNLAAGSYTLTVTDGNGCTATGTAVIVPSAGGPSIDETNAVTTNILCDGTLGSISGITATGTGLIYSWSNSGGNSIDASNLTAGNYILTVTDGNGCTATSTAYTINAPIPLFIDASVMNVSPTGCTSNTGSISGITINGGINPVASWSTSASTLNISNLGAGTYTLTVIDDQGCSDVLDVPITTLNAPTINTATMVVANENCNQSNGSITGINVNGGTPGYTYSWNTTPVSSTADISNLASGDYTLTVTDTQGCTDTEVVTVGATAGPVIDATTINVVQPTCTVPGSINGISVNGASPFTYVWTNTTQTTLAINNLSAGSYSLTVTDINGCQSLLGPEVLNPASGPTANFSWSPTDPNIDELVVFTNTSTGVGLTNYSWTIEGLNITTEDINHTFVLPGSYTVTMSVEDANGCSDTIAQTVIIYDELGVPNVITANDDNLNDSFEISGLKPNTTVVILNRWGNVVFESSNYLNDWKGYDKSGSELTAGVYTYLITTLDGKKLQGFVHLVR